MTNGGLRHGIPAPSRNDRFGFDKYVWPAGDFWPSGLEIHIYDDGRVKVGGWDTSVVVGDVRVRNFGPGKSRGGGHVVARFQPASD